MKCFKFLLPDNQVYDMGDGVTVGGMLVLVIDENADDAKACGRAWLESKGRLSRWLDHPQVVVSTYNLDSPVVLIGAEF